MLPTFATALALLALPFARAALQACPDLSQSGPDVFDFVVVGAGAGGGPIAARLAENGFSDPDTVLAYHITEFSTPNSRVAWFVYLAIHNAMINIIAGTRTDFDGIADAFDDQSWSRTNMQNYFKKIENNQYLLPTLLTAEDHGFDGWLKTTLLPYLNLLHDLDIVDLQLLTLYTSVTLSDVPILDLNTVDSDGSEGVNTPSFTVDTNHIRSSVYNRLTEVHDANENNLNITLNTLVTKVLLCEGSDGQPTAYGVEFVPGAALPVAGNFNGKQNLNGTLRHVMARREVIVSAGVFQSPQLLMLSGIGNSTELTKFGIETVVDLPGVGSNLQDHDEIAIDWKLTEEFKLLEGCLFLSNRTQDPCLDDWIRSDHQNVYAFNPVLHAIITKSDDALELPDTMTYVAPAWFCTAGRGEPQRDERGRPPDAPVLARDPLDIGKRHFEAPGGEVDLQALVTGLERIIATVEGSLIELFVEEQAFPPKGANLTQHVLDHVFGHHACCTNPIGTADDPDAVLDSEFRVRGTDRLRVVDLSSWPNVPGYFVTTPTYMISEKAADSIMNDARQ
ncbi:alcohol dehydrogenase [Mycena pura]|uniref:Alcohol dehydrogenase n=1 Tax=Mycena pura TaxID=153505 RepID=A0AAD6YKP0_9AGAR|nr:alcohol dehydrogenase [Mycena pura]